MLSSITLNDSTGAAVTLHADSVSSKRSVTSATGLIGIGAPRTDSKRARPQAHGAINESRYQEGATIVLEGEIASQVSIEDALAEFRLITAPMMQTLDVGAALLKWQEGASGNALQQLVKLDGEVLPVLHEAAAILDWQAHFFAEDPRAYAQALTTVDSSALASSGGGMAFPKTFPFTFSSSGGGTASVTNLGNRPTPPVFRIFGNIVNPQIVQIGGTGRIVLNGTVNSGDYLDVDVQARTIKLNGSSSRLNFLDPVNTKWFELPAGVTNLQMIAASFDGSALLRTLFRSAYA